MFSLLLLNKSTSNIGTTDTHLYYSKTTLMLVDRVIDQIREFGWVMLSKFSGSVIYLHFLKKYVERRSTKYHILTNRR